MTDTGTEVFKKEHKEISKLDACDYKHCAECGGSLTWKSRNYMTAGFVPCLERQLWCGRCFVVWFVETSKLEGAHAKEVRAELIAEFENQKGKEDGIKSAEPIQKGIQNEVQKK